MRSTPPEIPDDAWLTTGEAAKALGFSRQRLTHYANIGRKCGGLNFKISQNGRKKFSGRELKRFWREF